MSFISEHGYVIVCSNCEYTNTMFTSSMKNCGKCAYPLPDLNFTQKHEEIRVTKTKLENLKVFAGTKYQQALVSDMPEPVLTDELDIWEDIAWLCTELLKRGIYDGPSTSEDS